MNSVPGHAMTAATLALLAFCVVAETAQQLCFKVGVGRTPKSGGAIRGALLQPLVWGGVALWAAEVLAWILVLQRAPLSVAYPIMTLIYVSVPLAGVLLLRERLSRRQILGAVLIASGVLCVGISGARA